MTGKVGFTLQPIAPYYPENNRSRRKVVEILSKKVYFLKDTKYAFYNINSNSCNSHNYVIIIINNNKKKKKKKQQKKKRKRNSSNNCRFNSMYLFHRYIAIWKWFTFEKCKVSKEVKIIIIRSRRFPKMFIIPTKCRFRKVKAPTIP